MTSRLNKVRLNEIADITMGQSPSSEYYNSNGEGLPFFQGSSEFGQLYPSEKKYCSKPSRIAIKGDVLMSVRAPVGDLNIADKECCIGRGVCSIRSKTGDRFVYYLLKTNLELIKSFSGGTTYQSINKKEVNNLPLLVPPLLTQQKTASILSAYDNLIENNTRRIQILEEMAQQIYKEWFVDLKYPGHENDELVDSELGMIPEGWEVNNIGDLIQYHIGGGWGKEELSEEFDTSGYVIRGTDIPLGKYGSIIKCPHRYHKSSNMKSRELKIGDIVFEVSGGSKDQPLGRALLVNKELLNLFNDKVMCASFCKLIRPSNFSEYIYLHLLDIYRNREIMKYQVQSTGISNFKFQTFHDSHKIIKPPIKILDNFTELVTSIFSQIQILGKNSSNLRQTRDLLLPKLISGKVDVSELDIDTSILDD